jgi:hypothetical protein
MSMNVFFDSSIVELTQKKLGQHQREPHTKQHNSAPLFSQGIR